MWTKDGGLVWSQILMISEIHTIFAGYKYWTGRMRMAEKKRLTSKDVRLDDDFVMPDFDYELEPLEDKSQTRNQVATRDDLWC